MSKINSELEYEVISARIENLLALVDNATLENDKNLVELNVLSNLAADYEELL